MLSDHFGLSIEPVKLFEKIRPLPLGFDVLLAAGVLVFGLIGAVEFEASTTSSFTRSSDAVHTLLIVLMAVPLTLRRIYTTPVFVVILVAWAAARGLDYPGSPAAIAVAIAFYSVGAELSRKTSLRIGGFSAVLILGWTTIGVLTLESVAFPSLITTLISTVTPLLLGREMHARRRQVEELRKRAERAEQDREEKARWAVADERTRIARELHDVVAHQMTVMILQAEGAHRVSNGADPRVVEALQTISEAGHSVLAELRRTVGLLRTPEDKLETQPLPRLSDIGQLVSTIQGAGVQVDLDIDGDVRPLSDGTELSAYRIVQESLTNTVRHGGPGVTARVAIKYGPDQLDVLVSDDGRGAAADSRDDVGHGIVGMRERIAVLGGEFEAGPHTGGGYRVHATIPVES